MANVKIPDLTAYANPAGTDVLVIVDVGADVTKKVSVANLLKNAPAGTAAAPGIAFGGDNTGIYSPGADQVAIATGGIGRLFVDSSGKVGLGTGSPENKLHIVGTSATTNTGATILVDDSASLAADIGGSIAFRGTDGTNLRTYGLIRGGKFNAASGAFDGYLAFETRLNGQANTTERVRITNEGHVGIGTTSAAAKLQVSVDNDHTNQGNTLAVRGTSGSWAAHLGATSEGGALVARGNVSTKGSLIFGATDGSYASYTEHARIDSSGRLLINTSSARSNFFNTSTFSPAIQIEGTSNQNRLLSVVGSSAGGAGGVLVLASQKSGTVGGNTIVTDGGQLGLVTFQGSDGTEFVEAVRIQAEVDGTPGANDMPGRLVFYVTADGASSPTEAMRIKNTRVINFSNAPVYADNAAAKTGGLVDGDVYRTSTGDLKIVYT